MSKTAVIVCSNSAIDYLDYPKDIHVFRSKIHFGNETYNDFVEIDAKTFYERLAKNPEDVPKTSYETVGNMIETLNNLKKKGYDEALVITIARPLSGMHDALLNMKDEVDLKLTVFDSKILAYPESFMALTAHEMFSKGHSMDEVLKKLTFIQENNKLYFTVETLLYLVKNGRLSKLQGTLGTFLKIKPLLTFNADGGIETLEKIRTFNKALKRIVELYLEETKDENVITFISHAHNDQVVETLSKMIHEVYPERKIISAYLTPVVGAHAGPGSFALGYIKKPVE